MLHLEPRPIDLLDDALDGRRPDKGLGIEVPGLHEFLDRLFQVGHADEAATPQRLVGQFSEPALHQIEPAGTGRNEVTDEPGMLLQPRPHMRLLVRAVVVHHQM